MYVTEGGPLLAQLMLDEGEVRSRLEGIPGVREVGLSDFPDAVSIVVDREGATALIGEVVRSMLRCETGVDPVVAVTMEKGEARPERRSRFEALSVTRSGPGQISAKVVLEWSRRQWEGVAEGEFNAASELRVSAAAALRAVAAILDDAVSFTLLGVKELRVFDHNMVVVLVSLPDSRDQRLIGTSIIAGDRREAAVLAVLNATNRIVGRFVG